MKLRIIKHFGNYSQTFRIDLSEHSLGEVTVSRHTTVEGDKWKPAHINWPGCGDRDELNTMMFIMALQTAAYLCRVLDGEATLALTELNKICQCDMVDAAGNVVTE